tara:strand:+ start:2015 stop:3079 length:1065 start_codon:yes stop_codon:yes gene_type:complete
MKKDCDTKIKTSFIGFGKRTKLFYAPILKKLNDSFNLLGFTKKTKNNADSISNQYNINFYDSVDILLEKTEPDLLILSVPPPEIIQILKKVKNPNCVIFVDTPFYINTDQVSNLKILVSEQWPFLPIEQFKKLLINSGYLGETFYAENESRTFEYHGIAQLKNYFPKDKSISKIIGSRLSRPGEDWMFGLVKHSDNTGFLYKFSYFVKKSQFRTHQALKTYLTKGSIISGCLNEKGNDYEIFKISQELNNETKHFTPQVTRTSQEVDNKDTSYHSGKNYLELESISCKLHGDNIIHWNNQFVGLKLNDQEIAIATLLKNAKDFILDKTPLKYTAKSASQDILILNNIQQSSITN